MPTSRGMMRRPPVGKLAAVFFALLALWSGGSAAYLASKAALAQLLLERAFTRTLAGQLQQRPWRWADTWPLARLTLPDQRLIVLAGASGRNLAFGPAHLDGTPLPGAPGTSVIAGHRDTHFASLRRLAVHDRVLLETVAGTREYRVTAHAVLHAADAASVFDDHGPPRLALVTCYPFAAVQPNTPWRYVVWAEALPSAP